MKYLNPKADLTFKRVFGEHPDLVMSLLNALLPLAPEQEITDIEYLPSEMVPENPLRKNSIVDVRCKDKSGRLFLVEMQMIWSPEFRQRVLFNASKTYVRQLDSGEEYELLQPVYSLNLVNEIFEPEMEGYYHHYKMVHVENSDKVIDEKTEKVPQELLTDPEVGKAVKELERSAFTSAQLLGYEKFWDIISVEKTLYNSAKRRGKAQGLAEGFVNGEKQKQQDIARTMKKDGLPIDTIVKYTGLTASEISCL